MHANSLFGRARLALALAATTVGLVAAAAPTAASAATCSDVDVVFARGTFEAAGLGTVGSLFVSSLTSALSGRSVSSYAVNYAANAAQTSAGPGATDMSNHVSSVAASCPGTRFVIGGYSQGATVTDIAVGIRTGTTSGTPIPANLASRVAAVVVFGNPLGAQGGTIASESPTYGPKSRDYCNSTDTICGSGTTGTGSHLSYASNGSTTLGAQFAAGLVNSGGAPAPTPTTPAPTPTTPAPTPTPTTPAPTTPSPTPTPTTCVAASTSAHVAAGRAVSVFGRAYARGTRDSLGATSRTNIVSLRQTGTDSWTKVTSC